jgi:hypothetical protein
VNIIQMLYGGMRNRAIHQPVHFVATNHLRRDRNSLAQADYQEQAEAKREMRRMRNLIYIGQPLTPAQNKALSKMLWGYLRDPS